MTQTLENKSGREAPVKKVSPRTGKDGLPVDSYGFGFFWAARVSKQQADTGSTTMPDKEAEALIVLPKSR